MIKPINKANLFFILIISFFIVSCSCDERAVASLVGDPVSDALTNLDEAQVLNDEGPLFPDLKVESLTLNGEDGRAGPVKIESWESIILLATITNQGRGSSTNGVVRYYLSDSRDIFNQDNEIAPVSSFDALSPGARVIENFSGFAPTNRGTYYYGACVGIQVDEIDSSNNCSNLLTVTVPPSVRLVNRVNQRTDYFNQTSSVSTAKVGGMTYLFLSGTEEGGVDVYWINDINYRNDFRSRTTLLIHRDRLYDSDRFRTKVGSELELDDARSISTAEVGGTTYLFVGGYRDNGVSVFQVGENGGLLNVDNLDDSNNSRAIAEDELELGGVSSLSTAQVRGSTYLFVAGYKDDGVSVFLVRENGRLVNVDNLDHRDTNRALAGNKLMLQKATSVSTAEVGGTTYLFVTGEVDGGVSVFWVEEDGRLVNVDNVTDSNDRRALVGSELELNGASSASTAKIEGTTYLFVVGFDDNGVSVFRVGENGRLVNVDNVDDGDDSRALAGDELELGGAYSLTATQIEGTTYLFVAGKKDNGVSVFRVESDGQLFNVQNLDSDSISWDLEQDELDKLGELELTTARSFSLSEVAGTTILFVTRLDGWEVSFFDVESNKVGF